MTQQKQQLSPANQRKEQLKPFLVSAQRQIESLLSGDTARAKQFMAASLVVASDQALSKCDPESIIQALVGVAMLELSIDKNIAHVYLVPYAGKAQLQVGYKGFIQLLFRAGWAIKAFPVYHCDTFSMDFDGWDNRVEFKPDLDGRDESDNEWAYENFRGSYVVARHADTKDEYSAFVSKKVIEKLRLNSSNQKITQWTKPEEKKRLEQGLPVGVWELWYIEMAIGKAIKKLAKTLPIGDSRAQMAIVADDKADIGKPVNFNASAEEGFIIDMDEKVVEGTSSTGVGLDGVIEAINTATTKSQLDEILPSFDALDTADRKSASTAWKDRLKQIQAPETKKAESKPKETEKTVSDDKPTDWVISIKECGDKAGLIELISTMPPEIEMQHADLIDEKMDSLR